MQMFSCEFCEISHNIFFDRTSLVATSVSGGTQNSEKFSSKLRDLENLLFKYKCQPNKKVLLCFFGVTLMNAKVFFFNVMLL